jgi:hypothetical protein
MNYQAPGGRYVQLLRGQANGLNNGTNAGGLAHALNQGMMGLMMGRDQEAALAEKQKLEMEKQMQRGALENALRQMQGQTAQPRPAGLPPGVELSKNTAAVDAIFGARAPNNMAAAQTVAAAGMTPQAMSIVQAEQARQQAEALRAQQAAQAQAEYEQKRKDALADQQSDFDQQKELARLKASLGGDGPSGRPASPIQNFAERQRLVSLHGEGSPEVNRFDNYVRANQIIDTGSNQIIVNPANPAAPAATFANTLKPGEEPAVKGDQAAAIAEGAVAGKASGEAVDALATAEAALPELDTAVTELKRLGEMATYTMGGQAVDFGRRQIGMDPSKGALARTAYEAHVNNIILPLMRSTFGAQFTAEEGQSLKALLGDPNKSPLEKNAALDAFIANKKAGIETMRRRASTPTPPPDGPAANMTRVPQSGQSAPIPQPPAGFKVLP